MAKAKSKVKTAEIVDLNSLSFVPQGVNVDLAINDPSQLQSLYQAQNAIKVLMFDAEEMYETKIRQISDACKKLEKEIKALGEQVEDKMRKDAKKPADKLFSMDKKRAEFLQHSPVIRYCIDSVTFSHNIDKEWEYFTCNYRSFSANGQVYKSENIPCEVSTALRELQETVEAKEERLGELQKLGRDAANELHCDLPRLRRKYERMEAERSLGNDEGLQKRIQDVLQGFTAKSGVLGVDID